jgi:hypothetical protein
MGDLLGFMGNSLGLIVFFIMGLIGGMTIFEVMILLFKHEIDRDVLKLGFLRNVGLRSIAVNGLFTACFLLVKVLSCLIFSVIDGCNHVF